MAKFITDKIDFSSISTGNYPPVGSFIFGFDVVDDIFKKMDSNGVVTIIGGISGSTNNLWSAGTGTNSVVLANSTNVANGDYATAEGSNTTASGITSHAEGNNTLASGFASHAEGGGTTASGAGGHSEGDTTIALGESSHSEGSHTVASGTTSHAEGDSSTALGGASHAEGTSTIASGDFSHSEGFHTTASGATSHSEGNTTTALGNGSHSEGNSTSAITDETHAEGSGTIAGWKTFAVDNVVNGLVTFNSSYNDITTQFSSGIIWAEIYNNILPYSYSLGNVTFSSSTNTQIQLDDTSVNGVNYFATDSSNFNNPLANYPLGTSSHAEGINTKALGTASHAEGSLTIAGGNYSHAEGYQTTASGIYSHAEGNGSMAIGIDSHVEGQGTLAFGNQSHAEGGETYAGGQRSHAEGWKTTTFGVYSHTEGNGTTASGDQSHAEGLATLASGATSHAEGNTTTAFGIGSHAEGSGTTASGNYTHAEGNGSIAIGDLSHVEGNETIAGWKGFIVDSVNSGLININSGSVDYSGEFTSGIIYAFLCGNTITYSVNNVSYSNPFTSIQLNDTNVNDVSNVADINNLNSQYAVVVNGIKSHAEGDRTISVGYFSHSEGDRTEAIGMASHAEGSQNKSLGFASHAGGSLTIASGDTSFVHGTNSTANGSNTIVLGRDITGNADRTTYVEDFVIKKFESIPIGSNDPIGENGSVTWDDTNFYWKANNVWLSISGMSFGDLPVLTTASVTSAFYPQATTGGDITYEGTSSIISYGVVWSLNPNPTLDDDFTVDGSGGGSFVSTVTGITQYSTNYYVRAYATNDSGTAYGNQQVFQLIPCLAEGTKIKLSNNTYKKIEDVIYDDELLVWDFDLGTFESAKPIWIKTPQTTDRYNKLVFSDGTILKTIGQHRIFNIEKESFTYPMTDNTPIGTTTFNSNGDKITLISKEVVIEPVNYYNIMTDRHINLFAEDILTSSRYNNIYPIENMRFVKDTNKLRPREEFANISDRFYYGLRLSEQKLTIEEIERSVNMLETLDLKLELV